MSYKSEIQKHLEICKDCTSLSVDNNNNNNNLTSVFCSCGKSWSISKVLIQEDPSLKEFIGAAQMFNFVIRQNSVPLDEVINPILGICLGNIKHGRMLDIQDIDLF